MSRKKDTNAHISLLKGTDADPFTAGPKYFSEEDDEIPAVCTTIMTVRGSTTINFSRHGAIHSAVRETKI